MADIRVQKLAELLVDYSVAVKPGDKVAIEGDVGAQPLLKEIYARVLQAGGYPFILMYPDGIMELTYKHSSDDQLKYVPEISRTIVETYDVRIHVAGESNTKGLSSVPPSRLVMRSAARRELSETMLERSARGELRWVITNFPTAAYAQDAEMSLDEYEDFLYGACLPDLDDPVGYWKKFSARQQKYIDWLKGKKHVTITAPGTDLSLDVTDRIFVNCDGRLNMPDGERHRHGPVLLPDHL